MLADIGVLPGSSRYYHEADSFTESCLYFTPHAGDYRCNREYEVARDHLDVCQLILVEEGQLYVEYNGESYVAPAGSLVLLDCRRPHTYGAIDSVSFRYIYFRGGSSDAYYRLLAGENGYFTRPARSVEVQSAIQSIFALVTDTMYDEHRVSVQLYRILAELSGSDGRGESVQNAAVLHAIAYMEHHFFEKLTIEQIADQVNLSEYYFSRLFRRCTSMSPHAYLVNLRITMARQLLTVSQKSVERIAEECGFHSTTNFIRSFREHVGCTPKQFRRAAMEEHREENT